MVVGEWGRRQYGVDTCMWGEGRGSLETGERVKKNEEKEERVKVKRKDKEEKE